MAQAMIIKRGDAWGEVVRTVEHSLRAEAESDRSGGRCRFRNSTGRDADAQTGREPCMYVPPLT